MTRITWHWICKEGLPERDGWYLVAILGFSQAVELEFDADRETFYASARGADVNARLCDIYAWTEMPRTPPEKPPARFNPAGVNISQPQEHGSRIVVLVPMEPRILR
jgi:hypothetical protein